MPDQIATDDELLSYLDEMLPVERMAEVERSLRSSDDLRQRLASLVHGRDQGVHSVGEIWRRKRLSCPSRKQLGSFLLEALDSDHHAYIEFHIRSVGCRICDANLRDLENSMQATPDVQQRRKRYFQSSAGYLSQLNEDD